MLLAGACRCFLFSSVELERTRRVPPAGPGPGVPPRFLLLALRCLRSLSFLSRGKSRLRSGRSSAWWVWTAITHSVDVL